MGARESEAMKVARKLVLAGKSPYHAAKTAGITRNAIYMAPWYKELRDAKKKLQSEAAG